MAVWAPHIYDSDKQCTLCCMTEAEVTRHHAEECVLREPLRHFTLTYNESLALFKWALKHKFRCAGGPIDLGAFQTGIGAAIHVRCQRCEHVEDITDYGSW
jgi:hypothetical protein